MLCVENQKSFFSPKGSLLLHSYKCDFLISRGSNDDICKTMAEQHICNIQCASDGIVQVHFEVQQPAKTRQDQIFNWCSHASGDKLLLRRICKSVGRPVSQELPDHRYSQTALGLPILSPQFSFIFVYPFTQLIQVSQIGTSGTNICLYSRRSFQILKISALSRPCPKKLQPKQHINGKEADINSQGCKGLLVDLGVRVSAAKAVYAIVPEPWFGLALPPAGCPGDKRCPHFQKLENIFYCLMVDMPLLHSQWQGRDQVTANKQPESP